MNNIYKLITVGSVFFVLRVVQKMIIVDQSYVMPNGFVSVVLIGYLHRCKGVCGGGGWLIEDYAHGLGLIEVSLTLFEGLVTGTYTYICVFRGCGKLDKDRERSSY